MNIELDGYFDRNLGDDLMFKIIAHQLKEYEFYAFGSKGQMARPFETTSNIHTGEKCDVISAIVKITGAGFQVSNLGAQKYATYYYLRDLFAVRKIPMVTLGCNIEPFYSVYGKWLMIQKLKNYSLITCRDKYSYDFISQNIKKNEVTLLPDIVFGIDDSVLGVKNDEGCLGISVALRGNEQTLVEEFSKISDGFIDKTGKKVLLLAFDMGIEDDLQLCEKILNNCKNREMVQIVSYNDNEQNILTAMNKCRIILGCRFHSIVLSMRMGIPFIPLVYGYKTRNLLSDFKYNNRVYNMYNFDSSEILGQIINNGVSVFGVTEETIKAARQHSVIFKKFLEENV